MMSPWWGTPVWILVAYVVGILVGVAITLDLTGWSP